MSTRVFSSATALRRSPPFILAELKAETRRMAEELEHANEPGSSGASDQ
jgi:hypothetical protein